MMDLKETKKITVLLILIGAIIDCSSATAQTVSNIENTVQKVQVLYNKIDWEIYDTASTISKNNIKIQDVLGLWIAYKGAYRFDDIVNTMILSDPVIFEAKGNAYRRNAKGDFKKFILNDNLIIKADEAKIDTGIINKITSTELTITWKNKANYTRYYYKK